MKYSDTYAGPMDSNYGGQGTQIPLFMNQYLGAPTSATTPLQLPQVTQLAASGIMNVEIGTIDPQQFERIPKKHFTEMKQLAKLQGIQLSMHAPPVLDTAGFEQNRWSEEIRKNAEVYMRDFLEKAAMLQSEEGVKVPMVMHASGNVQAKDNLHWDQKQNKWIADVMAVVNPETGQMTAFEREVRLRPDGGEQIMTPEMRLEEMNQTQWEQTKLQPANYSYEIEETRRRLGEIMHLFRPLDAAARSGTLPLEQKGEYENYLRQIMNLKKRESILNDHLRSSVMTNFDKYIKSWQYADPSIMDKSEKYIHDNVEKLKAEFKRDHEEYMHVVGPKLEKLKNEMESKSIRARTDLEKARIQVDFRDNYNNLMEQYNSDIFNKLTSLPPPQTFVPVEHLAKQKAPKTWANAMYDTYRELEARKKAGEKVGDMPVLAVENWDVKYPMGMADDLREGIKTAREIFVDRAKKDGKSEEWAKNFAKEHIGATWDVGHINFLRKYMDPSIPEKQRKDIIAKESAKIAPDLKHMHLHDNFGFQDVHLPPGAGNVPFKEIMEQMEKAGKTGKVRKILESYAAVAELKYNPHQETLTHLEAPVYSGGGGQSWGQWNNYFFGSHGYLPGYGDMLPQVHFSMYGSGFSQLPTAVGGQIGGGDKSKFAGAPMS